MVMYILLLAQGVWYCSAYLDSQLVDADTFLFVQDMCRGHTNVLMD